VVHVPCLHLAWYVNEARQNKDTIKHIKYITFKTQAKLVYYMSTITYKKYKKDIHIN